MSTTDLDAVGRLLQEVTFEPEEMARLERVVMAVNGQVRDAARDRLVFDDEPAAYALAVARVKTL